MTDHNTSNVNLQAPTPAYDEAVIADPLQRRGYVRVYRHVFESVGVDAAFLYGVLEDYAQLSIRNRMPCVPTHEDLSEKTHLSIRSIERGVAMLRDNGWIKTQKLSNGRNRYTLLSDPTANSGGRVEPPANSGGTQPPNMAGAIKASQTELTRHDNPPTPQGGDWERVGSDSDEYQPVQPTPRAHRPAGAPQEGNGVFNPVDIPPAPPPNRGVTNETVNPWWTEARSKRFQFLYDNYPKMSPLVEAKVAMRLTFGEGIDDPDFMNRVWHGLQWWKNKWKAEDTEERYIPAMARWIERRQWEQAAVNPGVMAGVSGGS